MMSHLLPLHYKIVAFLKCVALMSSLAVFLACSFSPVALATPAATFVPAVLPSNTPLPAPAGTSTPVPTSTSAPSQAAIPVSASPIQLVIPAGLATGASVQTIDATSCTDECYNTPNTPAYLELTFEGYGGDISVYPAPQYGAENPGAAYSIQQLKEILLGKISLSQEDALPVIPDANAAQVLASQEKIIHFNGGSGLRIITQYQSDVRPVNNAQLFYLFQGLSRDGRYYILARLWTTLPFLPADANSDSPVPAGGIPFSMSNENYIQQITDLINATPSDQFNPTLNMLDSLIQSISTQ
jgi:hypothetical protein